MFRTTIWQNVAFLIVSKVAELPRWALSRAPDTKTRDPSSVRTKLGCTVTGQTVKSYYTLGSRTKLASWTAPGVTFLGSRWGAESV